MSLFSLIDHCEIHLPPDKIVVKSEDFQKIAALDLLQAEALEAIQRFKKEALFAAEKAREAAEAEGFQRGLEKWALEMAHIEEEIQKNRQECEKAILKTAIMAAQKFVARELKQDPSTLVDIVKNSLKAVVQHKRISVFCHPKDFQILEQARPELKQLFEELEILAVYTRDTVQPGGYVIETERGIINNSDVSKVWDVLEHLLGQALRSKKIATPTGTQA